MSNGNLDPATLGQKMHEIDRVLVRVERSDNFYQMLAVAPHVNRDGIVSGYRETVAALNPVFNELKQYADDALARRVKAAIGKVGQAYSVLFNAAKRQGYDADLASAAKSGQPSASQSIDEESAAGQGSGSASQGTNGSDVIQSRVFGSEYRVYGMNPDETERRRCGRLRMTLPARITTYSKDSDKTLVTGETIDVSRTGASIKTAARPRIGHILHLVLPMPSKLRTHSYADHAYNTYAIVRRSEPGRDSAVRLIGVEFLGLHPPMGFLEKPWGIFRLGRWSGPDRRREPRLVVPEKIEVVYLDGETEVGHEPALTENISPGGLRILARAIPPSFDLIRISCQKMDFEGLAVPCDRFRGADGKDRICLKFVDKKWPVPETDPQKRR